MALCTVFSVLNFPSPMLRSPLAVRLVQLSCSGAWLTCLVRGTFMGQHESQGRFCKLVRSAFCHHSLAYNCRPEGVSLLIIPDVLMNAVHLQKLSKTISNHFYCQHIGPQDTFSKYISFQFTSPWVFPGKYYPYVSVLCPLTSSYCLARKNDIIQEVS